MGSSALRTPARDRQERFGCLTLDVFYSYACRVTRFFGLRRFSPGVFFLSCGVCVCLVLLFWSRACAFDDRVCSVSLVFFAPAIYYNVFYVKVSS